MVDRVGMDILHMHMDLDIIRMRVRTLLRLDLVRRGIIIIPNNLTNNHNPNHTSNMLYTLNIKHMQVKEVVGVYLLRLLITR